MPFRNIGHSNHRKSRRLPIIDKTRQILAINCLSIGYGQAPSMKILKFQNLLTFLETVKILHTASDTRNEAIAQ